MLLLLNATWALQIPPATATAAPADGYTTYAEVANTTVSTNKRSACTTAFQFESGNEVYIAYFPRRDRVSITLWLPLMTAIAEGKSYQIKVIFLKHEQFDQGWGEAKAEGGRLEGKPTLDMAFAADAMLDDIAESTHVAFKYNDKLVGSFNLANSAVVIKSLRACGAQIVKLNPIDPFE